MTINKKTDDLKISSMKELVSPIEIINEIPMTDKATETVLTSRKQIIDIINKKDNRLLMVVGPCSIHDVDAATEYANRLLAIKNKVSNNILIIMRVYFEKPRTVIGWKGLINDPDLDNSFNINKGIKIARSLLLDLAEKGDPKAVDLMMDWAHGPAGHFGGHPVPGLHHINLGGSIVINGSVKNALGVDFRACDNYKNGFEAAKKLKCPVINILGDQDRMCPVKEGKKLANNINGSEVEVIENCGHMILLEEAGKSLAILKKFIRKNHPTE